MVEFNLVEQPWIRVRWLAGDLGEVSFTEVFARAGEIRELAGELPTQDFAVLRVLLAVLYRAVDAEEPDDPTGAWRALWEDPDLPMAAIAGYLAQWRHRFDLFDAHEPFLQVADLRTAKGETKPLEILVPDSDGLFPMRASVDSLTPGEAARWVVHCHAYDISGIKSGAIGDPRVKGGKGYPLGIGWAGWMGGITALGDTLRETLLLNLVLNRPRDGGDVPLWEEPPLTAAPRTAVAIRGPLALLTWPQRRIRLIPEDGLVRSVLVCNGDAVPYTDLHHLELMSAWRYSDPQTKKLKRGAIYMPWTFEPGMALWRGLRAVLPLSPTGVGDKVPFISATVLTWLGGLEAVGVLDVGQILRIRVVTAAYGSNNAVWEDVGADELAFDLRLASAESIEAQDVVRTALERAEQATRIVGDLAANLSVAAGGTREDAFPRGRDAAYAAFDQAFRAWLRALDPGADLEMALTRWTADVRSICLELGAELVRQTGPRAWAGRLVETRNGKADPGTGRKEKKKVDLTTGRSVQCFRTELAQALPLPAPQQTSTQGSGDA